MQANKSEGGGGELIAKPSTSHSTTINLDTGKPSRDHGQVSSRAECGKKATAQIKHWHYKQTGIKSRPIKLLKHPIEHIERKIILTYLLGFLFKSIAIISGPLIVLVVYLITLPIVAARRLLWFILNLPFTFDARIKTVDGHAGTAACAKQVAWNYCPLDHVETYWFKDQLVNNVILAVEHKNQEFTIQALRSLVRENILSKPDFRKFLSRVIKRGVPFYKSYYWHHLGLASRTSTGSNESPPEHTTQGLNSSVHSLSDKSVSSCGTHNTSVNQFSITSIADASDGQFNLELVDKPNKSSTTKQVLIEDHVFLDNNLKNSPLTQRSIRKYAYRLLDEGMNMQSPLWEIRMLPSDNGERSYLIFRCHQSLADGRSLCKILTDHLTTSSTSPTCIASGKAEDDNDEQKIDQEYGLRALKEKKSFISRMTESNSSKSAILVGPLTVLLWIIWTFTRRKNNHLNKCRVESNRGASDVGSNHQDRRFYMTNYSLTKFHQIKQMTRSTVSDVILCALSGALRDYLSKFAGVSNPPNLNISLAVDMRQPKDHADARTQNPVFCDKSMQPDKANERTSHQDDVPQVKCTLVNVPLPTSIEGTVPRLWELRSTMHELRTSADPWVMLGLQYFLYNLLPTSCYQWVINFIALRNSSVLLSNIRGPQNMVEAWCVDLLQRAFLETQQVPTTVEVNPEVADYESLLYKGKNKAIRCQLSKSQQDKVGRLNFIGNIGTISAIFYCMQPPTSDVPISFNCITYHDKLYVTSLSRSLLVEDSKLLTRLFFKQLDQLADTIAKRRSLVTIMRAPVPIEISCEPASPMFALERKFDRAFAASADRDFISETGPASPSRIFHKDDIEAGVGTGDRDNRCRACKQSVCSCRRRKSLFSFDKQHYLFSLLNPIQSKSFRTKTAENQDAKHMTDDTSAECLCGQQFLEELDDDAVNRQDKDISSVGSRSSNDEIRRVQPTCSKCRSIIRKQSTVRSSEGIGEDKSSRQSDTYAQDYEAQSSSKLTVPQNGGFYNKHHSKSETDLMPNTRQNDDSGSDGGGKSQSKHSDSSIYHRSKPIAAKHQSSISSGASSTCVGSKENITPPKCRNIVGLSRESLSKCYISKRRKSVAIGSESSHIQRFVVVKDKINADVSLRYQLDGPFSLGMRHRRFSTIGNAVVQRRASLIPFGLMSNQNLPKLFCEDGVDL